MLRKLEAGRIRVHFVESTEPSVIAHEILNGKPYTFLDDAPLEERRTRAVQMRRGLPLQAAALAELDPDALERVRAEATPRPPGAGGAPRSPSGAWSSSDRSTTSSRGSPAWPPPAGPAP